MIFPWCLTLIPLTTIRQDFEQIGREATRLLIRTIEQPTAPRQQRLLPAQLVQRRSAISEQ